MALGQVNVKLLFAIVIVLVILFVASAFYAWRYRSKNNACETAKANCDCTKSSTPSS